MSVDFFFEPANCDIPTKAVLRNEWCNIPNKNIIDVVAGEEQYFIFQRFLLDNLYFTKEGCACSSSKPYAKRLDWTVRAGAIKASILLASSIAEAVLRAHAEKRQLPLNADEKRRTFGNVLNAWLIQKNPDVPPPDIAQIWTELKDMQDSRNNVHLFKVSHSPDALFHRVL